MHNRPHTNLKESASQTAGPYVHIGCIPSFAGLSGMYGGDDLGATMLEDNTEGTRITIEGRIFDGYGAAIKDAMIEIWQADATGTFASEPMRSGTEKSGFSGWGRQATDSETGHYKFETIKPGRVRWPDGCLQAPHIAVWIVARGINLGLNTRIYFADEQAANAEDPLLARIEHVSRVATLIASGVDGKYHFDIHLQGDMETVFFDV